ncbi:MAG TPA: serine/threonine-protein kinase, partial [Acidimicrobiales bacterium]|nr:serine/threonine-protein kinase [Acidimicrobiales bacterium]
MTSAVPTTPLAGRFRLEQLLGHGGMADVYRATDVQDGTVVAVKVVRSSDPELAQRLTREARAVAGFDHPGLVRLLDAGLHEQHAFLVMELVEGQTLAERLRRGPLPTDRCAALGVSLAGALAYVHRRGVVHRDVKPANVLLGPGSRVRLADFGIAQVLDASTATVTGTTLGTAAYMAPEQLADHRVGPAADVWALAAVLLECLTGLRAFAGSPAEVVARRLAGALPTTDELPAPWRMVLDAMFEADPGRRPEAGEVSELLRSPVFARHWDPRPTQALRQRAVTEPEAPMSPPTLVAGEPAVPMPVPASLSTPRRQRRRRTVAVGSAAALAAALAGSLATWALTGSSTPPRRHPPAASTTTTTA